MKTKLFRKLLFPLDFVFNYLDQFGAFGLALIEYLFHKSDQFIWGLRFFTIKNIELFLNLKFQAVSSLIWSRGRLVKSSRYIFIVGFSLLMYMVGGVFQGQFIEKNQFDTTGFLASSPSILYEKASAATFSGEITLLDEPIEHIVQATETLDSIGRQYGISVESLKYSNNLASDNIKEGQVLQIPPVEGTLHTVKKNQTIEQIAKIYNVPSQSIVDFNYIDEPYILTEGQILTIPNAEAPTSKKFYAGTNTYDISAYGIIPYAGNAPAGTGSFAWPFAGVISQGFSRIHPAIDIAHNSGDIFAADKGKVIRAGWWQGGYGNAVQIDHGNGYVTTYAHMSVIAVSNGQNVERGQKIGVVGSTGRSTGFHVHFSMQYLGSYIDPRSQLP